MVPPWLTYNKQQQPSGKGQFFMHVCVCMNKAIEQLVYKDCEWGKNNSVTAATGSWFWFFFLPFTFDQLFFSSPATLDTNTQTDIRITCSTCPKRQRLYLSWDRENDSRQLIGSRKMCRKVCFTLCLTVSLLLWIEKETLFRTLYPGFNLTSLVAKEKEKKRQRRKGKNCKKRPLTDAQCVTIKSTKKSPWTSPQSI